MIKKRYLFWAIPLSIAFVMILSTTLACSASAPNVETIYKTQEQFQKEFAVDTYAPNNQISGDYNASNAAKCNNGTFVGYTQNDVNVWKGIPYAKQPLGELRFKQAQAPDDSDSVFEAQHFGSACMQAPSPGEKASLYHQGEDCLNLNIWSSNLMTSNKPILVYIHGGGWISGGSADPLYNGYNFANYNPDIMLVTINYRTGMMGMIDLSSFEGSQEYDTSINNSLLDMVQALKWLKQNGAAFGGDVNNITICGESAGGGAVSALCIMDSAKGLFNKAIPMSGGVDQIQKKDNTTALPIQLKKDFNISSVKQATEIPFEKLCEWWNVNGESVAHHIIRDGKIVPADPVAAYEDGAAKDILMLQGATTNEFEYYIAVFHWVYDIYDKACTKLREACVNSGNDEFKAAYNEYVQALKDLGVEDDKIDHEFASDKALEFINTYQAECQSKNGKDGYAYAFDIGYDGDYITLGAAHAVDCHYLFGNFDGNHAKGNKAEVDASRNFQRMISNFCKNGDPSTDKVKWDKYNSNSRTKMILREEDFHQINNYQGARIDALCKMSKSSDVFRYAGRMGDLINSVAKDDPESFFYLILGELIAQNSK